MGSPYLPQFGYTTPEIKLLREPSYPALSTVNATETFHVRLKL